MEADVEKVEKCLSEKMAWYEQKLRDAAKLSPYNDPTVLASQIRQEKKVCTSVHTLFSVWSMFKMFVSYVVDTEGDRPKEDSGFD